MSCEGLEQVLCSIVQQTQGLIYFIQNVLAGKLVCKNNQVDIITQYTLLCNSFVVF